jgi:type I restriction enzyme S subunit
VSPWPQQPLGNVCEVVMGQAPSGEAYNQEGRGYPLIAGAGDFDGIRPAPKRFTTEAAKLSVAGDIILAIRATIGEKVWANGTYCLGRGVAALRPGSAVDKMFLWHWLTTARADLNRKARGATFKQVTKDDVVSLEIPLPPLPDQRRVGRILDRAEELRQKRRVALGLLDTLSQSLFLEMFGDPTTNPKGWKTQPMGQLLSVKHGFAFKSEYFRNTGEFVLLTPGNFYETGGYRDRREKQKYYVGPIPDGYILSANDLLVAMTEQAPGLLGSPILIPESNRFLHNQRLGLVKLTALAEKQFVFHMFNSRFIRSQIAASATGTKVKHTSPGQLTAIRIPIPPISLQREFARRALAAENLKVTQRTSVTMLNALFASLQHRAFQGEL